MSGPARPPLLRTLAETLTSAAGFIPNNSAFGQTSYTAPPPQPQAGERNWRRRDYEKQKLLISPIRV